MAEDELARLGIDGHIRVQRIAPKFSSLRVEFGELLLDLAFLVGGRDVWPRRLLWLLGGECRCGNEEED
jgi:hypothetical protein